jgi:hypothetical protein
MAQAAGRCTTLAGIQTDGAPLTLIARHPWQCRTRSDGALRAQRADAQPEGSPSRDRGDPPMPRAGADVPPYNEFPNA